MGISDTFEQGTSLMECARSAGVELVSLCGGEGRCGKCVVEVLEGEVSPPTPRELAALSHEGILRGHRLACQASVLGPARVMVPAESLSTSQRIQIEGLDAEVPPDRPVRCLNFRLTPPSTEDPAGDADRIAGILDGRGRHIRWDLRILESVPAALRRWSWRGKVALRYNEVTGLLPQEAVALGVAVDLGTTKIAVYLLDLEDGHLLGAQGIMNPQRAYGEDVMSRISMAMQSTSAAKEMQRIVIEALNQAITALCGQYGQEPQQVMEVSIAGNTAMHHLLLGLPVDQLGRAPYVPAVCSPVEVKARELGLAVGPGAYVYMLPNIAGFVGGDHVAMLMACSATDKEGIVLALDIGTNTEVCLISEGTMKSVSCASGPAFEGAHIKYGMRAAPGAIERVKLQGQDVIFSTVGDGPPVGICGSGLVDLVAEMLREGIMDCSGRILEHPRVRKSGGQREFVVVEGGEGRREVVLTQGDIRQLQLAKGAIRAGIEVLLDEFGVGSQEIDELIVAGAFGTYLDAQNAMLIGMLPQVPLQRVRHVGNAAGTGARLALLSGGKRMEAREISNRVNYVELAAWPGFNDLFVSCMSLAAQPRMCH
jgi:uncharacterized 2Fe-2S/4Fe-4S cluster protein (DUF4445 family)